MKTRYEILGLAKLRKQRGAEDLAAAVEENLEYLEEEYFGLGNYPPEFNQRAIRKCDIEFCYELAIYQHLQLNIGSFDVEEYIEEGAQIAVDYFYGDCLKKDRDAAYAMKKSPRK